MVTHLSPYQNVGQQLWQAANLILHLVQQQRQLQERQTDRQGEGAEEGLLFIQLQRHIRLALAAVRSCINTARNCTWNAIHSYDEYIELSFALQQEKLLRHTHTHTRTTFGHNLCGKMCRVHNSAICQSFIWEYDDDCLSLCLWLCLCGCLWCVIMHAKALNGWGTNTYSHTLAHTQWVNM